MDHPHAVPAATEQVAGFTLVEIMVVIVILGMLAALVVPNVVDAGDRAREATTRTNAVSIASAVKGYRASTGRLPTSLQALVEKDAKGRSELDDLPRDPWGHEFALRECDGGAGWEVVSPGPDGIDGTGDDISSRPQEP